MVGLEKVRKRTRFIRKKRQRENENEVIPRSTQLYGQKFVFTVVNFPTTHTRKKRFFSEHSVSHTVGRRRVQLRPVECTEQIVHGPRMSVADGRTRRQQVQQDGCYFSLSVTDVNCHVEQTDTVR